MVWNLLEFVSIVRRVLQDVTCPHRRSISTQTIPLTIIPILLSTLYTMSHHLTEEYWELLGPNGPFLHEIFHTQSQQLSQLQTANNVLKDCTMEAQTDVADATAKAMSAIPQAILKNMPTGSHSSRGAKAAEPVSFDGSRDKAEQFV